MKIFSALISILLLVYGCLMLIPPKPVKNVSFYDDTDGLVIAHRAGRGLMPGNTLAAAKNAISMGSSIVELDIQMTKDEMIVVRHDATIESTSNGAGFIREMSFKELSEYKFGFNKLDFPNADKNLSFPISLLASFFELFPSQRFMIEIKPTEPKVTKAVCDIITKSDAHKRVLIGSFNTHTLKIFRDECPHVATSLGRSEITWAYILKSIGLGNLFRSSGYSVQLPYQIFDSPMVRFNIIEFFHEMNMKVDVWTVNNTEKMEKLINLGVDGIITDYPDLLLSLSEGNK